MHEACKAVEEAITHISPHLLSHPTPLPEAGFKHVKCTILVANYKRVMKYAVKLRREGVAENRAEALEIAFDHAVSVATEGQWIRTGEVNVNRQEGSVKAF